MPLSRGACPNRVKRLLLVRGGSRGWSGGRRSGRGFRRRSSRGSGLRRFFLLATYEDGKERGKDQNLLHVLNLQWGMNAGKLPGAVLYMDGMRCLAAIASINLVRPLSHRVTPNTQRPLAKM